MSNNKRLYITEDGTVMLWAGPDSNRFVGTDHLSADELRTLITLLTNPSITLPMGSGSTSVPTPPAPRGGPDRHASRRMIFIYLSPNSNSRINLTDISQEMMSPPVQELYTLLRTKMDGIFARADSPPDLLSYAYMSATATYNMEINTDGDVSISGVPIGQLSSAELKHLMGLLDEATRTGDAIYGPLGSTSPTTSEVLIRYTLANRQIQAGTGAKVPAQIQTLFEELAAIYTQFAQ